MDKDINKDVVEFLKLHDGKQNLSNRLLWRIKYENIQCAAIISVNPVETWVEIRPINGADDIGSGAGAGGSVFKTFKNYPYPQPNNG